MVRADRCACSSLGNPDARRTYSRCMAHVRDLRGNHCRHSRRSCCFRCADVYRVGDNVFHQYAAAKRCAQRFCIRHCLDDFFGLRAFTWLRTVWSWATNCLSCTITFRRILIGCCLRAWYCRPHHGSCDAVCYGSFGRHHPAGCKVHQ